MLDYKDVPRSTEARSRGRGRWRGPLLVVLAIVVLVGGLGFLAFDTLSVREEIKQERRGKEPQQQKAGSSEIKSGGEASAEEKGRELEEVMPQEEKARPEPAEQKPAPEDAQPTEDDEQRRIPLSIKPLEPEKDLSEKKAKEESKLGEENTQGAESDASEEADSAASSAKKKKEKVEPTEPHYDFYTLLPEYEVVIPEEDLSPRKPPVEPTKLEPIKVEADAIYLLQVGSFRTELQAEDTRARLALLGFEASIHESSANGKQWYRVRLGPYRESAELNDVRALLTAEGFGVLPLRARRP